jgi:hypothetical protein
VDKLFQNFLLFLLTADTLRGDPPVNINLLPFCGKNLFLITDPHFVKALNLPHTVSKVSHVCELWCINCILYVICKVNGNLKEKVIKFFGTTAMVFLAFYKKSLESCILFEDLLPGIISGPFIKWC